ncbi:MAG: CHAT domain-containing protein [Cyanobacteria bacterium J06632_22]
MRSFGYAVCSLTALSGLGSPAWAQVTAPEAGARITGVDSVWQLEGGTVVGNDLFDKLAELDLTPEQTVDFINALDTSNIFGPIVRGAPSSVADLLSITDSSANLYLINPAELLLGQDARFDVTGSFVGTPADRIDFLGNGLSVYGTDDYALMVGNLDNAVFSLVEPGAVISESLAAGQFIQLIGDDVVDSDALAISSREMTLSRTPGQYRLSIGRNDSPLALLIDPVSALTVAELPGLLTGGHDIQPAALLTRPDGTVQIAAACAGLTCALVSGELLGDEIAVTAPPVSLRLSRLRAAALWDAASNWPMDTTGQPDVNEGNGGLASGGVPSRRISNFEMPLTTAGSSISAADIRARLEESSVLDAALNPPNPSSGQGSFPVVDEVFFQELEQGLSESYVRYWSQPPRQELALQQVQTILSQAKQAHQRNAAVVYPLFMATETAAPTPPNNAVNNLVQDRSPSADSSPRELVLLMIPSVGEPIMQRVGVSENVVRQQARLFRAMAADPEDAVGYRVLSQQLYSWLVAPIEAELQQLDIDQLIYSPDEGLRALPLAAMHDGETFVIERYGVSMVPSMSLTEFEFDTLGHGPMLAGGASEFEQLAALPGVALELKRIREISSNAQVFFNQAFTLDNLVNAQQRIRPEVLHLATHAEFISGDASASYIQFWDERLSLDQFRTYDWQGIELLILSACTTAFGSAEAELGFAGLAMAAGVESSIGSLWTVSDIATLALMEVFYQQLGQGKGRAESLQMAQQQLLRGAVYLQNGEIITPHSTIDVSDVEGLPERADFTHPFYWSAFVAVGNPWL